MGTLYVLANGWIIVSLENGKAWVIRRWGTANGVGELANGPLPNTIKDCIPTPTISAYNVLFHFKVTGW